MAPRRYRKGKYARRRKTLSKYNVYTKKSAKAQARQIYALKRKINSVQRMCAPDTIRAVATATKLFSNQDTNSSATYSIFAVIPGANLFHYIDGSTGERPAACADNIFNIMGGYFRIDCVYSNNYSQVSDIGNCERHANIRVIFLRKKTAATGNPTLTTPANYIDNYTVSGRDYLMNHLRPFKEGITGEVEILYDKWKNINESKPQCSFKVPIPKLYQRFSQNISYPQNTLIGFVMVDGLALDATSHPSYVANVDISYVAKLNYSGNSVDAT